MSLYFLYTAGTIPAKENTVYSFGPKNGPHLVLTTPYKENSTALAQLKSLAEELAKQPPAIPVSIIITENDYSELPEELRTGYPSGTMKIVSLFEEIESGAVILLLEGKKETVTIKNGTMLKTSPRWILETTTECLKQTNMSWKVENIRMPLYRLGWLPENDLLSAYLNAGIPSLILQTDADIKPVLLNLIGSFANGINLTVDPHYLAFKYKNSLYFIGEKLLVAIMTAALAIILFYIFIFGFLFGKKSDQHRREFFHLWWLPFTYLLVTVLSLYLGQKLIPLLIKFRFGKEDAWIILPQIAFLGKIIVSSFFITVIYSLNQLIQFPEDDFIYGYIASIICMINILVFSSLDFSLTLLFLSVYIISFASYHLKHPIFQITSIILVYAPFFPYLFTLFSGGHAPFEPLYHGTGFWNFRLALFSMPFQLMMSRLAITLGLFGRKKRFYIPLNLVVVLIFTALFTALILFFPAWSTKKPLIVPVRHTIDQTGSRLDVRSPVVFQNLTLDPDIDSLSALSDPSSIIKIQSTSRKFLNRQLVHIFIQPIYTAQKIEVTVTSGNGLSVYDATYPYELLNAGMESVFSTPENPELPLVIDFTSDLESDLTVTVRVWTRTNPWNIIIKNEGLETDYLLRIERTFKPGESDTEESK